MRIELARVPLRYDVARKICDLFSVNPAWLANGGKETMRVWRNMPTPHDLGVDPNALFSEAFDTRLATIFQMEDDKTRLLPPDSPATLEEHSKSLGSSIACMFLGSQRTDEQRSAALLEILNNPLPVPSITIEAARAVAESLHQVLLQKAGKSPLPPHTTKLSSILEPGKLLNTHYQHVLKMARQESVKIDLTKSETSIRNVDVKAQLPELLGRLKEATSASGKKTELAVFLKAPLASVSRWLSGEREPGGEIALKMDAWATEQGYPRRPSNQK